MQRGRILVVDDDPLVRDVLLSILSHSGQYETECASNGKEAIHKVTDVDYDLVFTDLLMPGMSGIDFMREAVKLRPDLPFVVVTGNSTIDNAINAMREGAKDFITKPFNIASVTAVARRIIGENKLLGAMDTDGGRDRSVGRLNAELHKRLQEISILQSLSAELDSLGSNREIYGKIVEMISRLLTVREAAFGTVEQGTLRVRNAYGVTAREVSLAGSLFEQVVTTGAHRLAAFGEINPHTGRPLLAPFLALPFTMNGHVFGIISVSNKIDGTAFTDDEISLALTFARKAAQRIENNALYEVFYHNLINTLKTLVNSIEARDSYTKQHSERVTTHALRIADAMRLRDEDRDALRFGGYLHDIGKIGVRDTILLKPGGLTPEEATEIRLHPVIGSNIIKPLRFFPREREIILHHHEHVNGSGYPDRLSREAIPVTARVLAVADAYDAMTSTRPYRQARTSDHAVAELKRCSRTQFDGDVVGAFIGTLG